MSLELLRSSAASEWRRIRKSAARGLLFVDGPCGQLLHWSLGEKDLFGDNVVNVMDLEDREVGARIKEIPCTPAIESVVFVTTKLVRGERLQTIHRIVSRLCTEQQTCTRAFVYCTHEAEAHAGLVAMAADNDGGAEDPIDIFKELGLQLVQTMRKANRKSCTARFLHTCLLQAVVSPELFITPAYHTLQPLLHCDLEHISGLLPGQEGRQLYQLTDLEVRMLPENLRLQINCLARNFSSLCAGLDIQEHCFSLGPMSRLIASELASLPEAKARRKAATSKASIVFVDRSADMLSSLSRSSDNLAEKIFGVLPRLPHSCDVAVDMSPLLSVDRSCRHCVAPGCLSQPHNTSARNLLSSLIMLRPKEALMDVSRRLLDAISQQGLKAQLAPGKTGITPTLLLNLLQQFRDAPEALSAQSAIVQVAMATVNALQHENHKAWLKLQSSEKVLLHTLSEQGFSESFELLLTWARATASEQTDCISAVGLLQLTALLYVASGENVPEENDSESELQDYLNKVLLSAAHHKEEDIILMIGETFSQETVQLFLDSLFLQLRTIAVARVNLKAARPPTRGSSSSLLQELVRAILSPDKPDLPELEYHSQGLRDLLKTGFSLFMSVSKARPSDHGLLLVFVVGGLTCWEVKAMREEVAMSRTDIHVLVGGTRLLSPQDTLLSWSRDRLFDNPI